MCTLALAYDSHPQYKLIFIGNRDEFKARPTRSAHFWEAAPELLAGMDLKMGGTWTGITKTGRFATLTNYRDFSIPHLGRISRGYLTRDFLIGTESPAEYITRIKAEKDAYDPYNLLIGTWDSLWYYSNREDNPRPLAPGLYGLSNAFLDTPWPKVTAAKEALYQTMQRPFTPEDLFAILDAGMLYPDHLLPYTGAPLETERMLSSMHIDTDNYGTRFKTVLLIDHSGKTNFYERALNEKGHWQESHFEFQINAAR